MTASNFDEALKRVLVHEGGYADHPADPGGATMKGVTQRVYDGWRRRQGKATRAVRLITDAEVAAIYRVQYWDAIRGDDLPAGIDYATFDGAVNSGTSQATKWVQRALGVADDGQIGEATLSAARAADPAKTINAACDNRMAMLKRLKTFRTFGAGWTRRVSEVRRVALSMAAKSPLPSVAAETAGGSAKAQVKDRSITDIAKSPEAIAAGTSIGGSIINAAANPGPLAWALAAVIVIAAGVAAFYFIRRMREA